MFENGVRAETSCNRMFFVIAVIIVGAVVLVVYTRIWIRVSDL